MLVHPNPKGRAASYSRDIQPPVSREIQPSVSRDRHASAKTPERDGSWGLVVPTQKCFKEKSGNLCLASLERHKEFVNKTRFKGDTY